MKPGARSGRVQAAWLVCLPLALDLFRPDLAPCAQLLSKTHLISHDLNRAYLLERTQHAIGGFGKTAGDPPGGFDGPQHSSL